MTLDSLRLIRNILFRTLALSFVLNIFMALATFALWDTWTGLTSQWFHTNAEGLGSVILMFFTGVKFFVIFVLLAPALALHWTLRREMAGKVA